MVDTKKKKKQQTYCNFMQRFYTNGSKVSCPYTNLGMYVCMYNINHVYKCKFMTHFASLQMLLQNTDECFFLFMQQLLKGNKYLFNFGMKQ